MMMTIPLRPGPRGKNANADIYLGRLLLADLIHNEKISLRHDSETFTFKKFITLAASLFVLSEYKDKNREEEASLQDIKNF